jgi:2-(3-amino-3-carboxypropyl)histidine synthase
MYDLEIDRVIEHINKKKVKTVCIQLPDGLKPKAKKIVDTIESKTKAKCQIWAGSCFGACDIPKVKADLLIQWGHSKWKF